MMLERRKDDLVACFQKFFAPTLSDEVNGFGRALCIDDLVVIFGVDEAAHYPAHGFVLIGRADAQFMHAAVDIGIIVFHKTLHRLHHHARLLGRCGAIEIDERMAVHLLFKNRKVLAVLVPR